MLGGSRPPTARDPGGLGGGSPPGFSSDPVSDRGYYEFIGFVAMDVTKPYKFMGFGAMDVTNTCFFYYLKNQKTS